MKIFKFEEKIINWFINNKKKIFLILITVMALVVRLVLFNFKTSDYIYCLKNWFGHYQNFGIKGLKYTIGDYNCVYNIILAILSYIPIYSLYSIKFVSVIFDFLCAIYGAAIVFHITKNKNISLLTYCIILFIPTCILNSSAWGQCDSIYTAFAIMSLYYLLKNKYCLSFIMAGISFSFKLQFVFLLPIYVIYYIKERKFSVFNFLLIPIVNIIFAIPSILLGRNPLSAIFVYYYQASKFSSLVLKFPNIYNFLPSDSYFGIFGICLTFVALLCILINCIVNIKKLSGEKILLLSTYIIVIVTYFLPHMHERYLFMADIISVIWFLINRDLKKIWVPIIINITSLYTYIHCIFNILLVNYNISSILYSTFVICFSIATYRWLKDNGEKNV